MTIRYRANDTVNAVIDALVEDDVASRLGAGDRTLWGPDVESDAAVKLSWLGLPHSSRALLAEVAALRSELREEDLDEFVLAANGSCVLAVEAFFAASGIDLHALDSAEPQQVATALSRDLTHVVLVVCSKTGNDQSSDAIRRIYEQAFTAARIDYRDRIIVVTDPDSPLHTLATERQYRRVFLANSHLGGQFGALGAYGLVPAGLAGADIAGVLDDAAAISPSLATNDASNPANALAAVLSAALRTHTDKLVIAHGGTTNFGVERWVECFVAESAVDCGTWLLPVLVESDQAIGYRDAGQDAIKIAFGTDQIPAGGSGFAIAAEGPLGSQILLWQYAIAILGRLQGGNPFAQPDSVHDRLQKLLDIPSKPDAPCATDDGIEIYAPGDWLREVSDVRAALDALAACVPPHGFFSITAFLDQPNDAETMKLRPAIAAKTAVQTTLEWGARSTYTTEVGRETRVHSGVFLQITASAEHDLPIPGRSYSLAALHLAQASDHAAVLADRALPVLRLHLTDRAIGLATIVKALDAPA